MNQEEITEMAKQAGYFLYDLTETHGKKTVETDEDDEWAQLERFAKLVAAKEREACAKVAEDSDYVVYGRGYHDQLGDADATARNIVAAIRARGEA